jgi:hypothetical protein
MKKNILTILFFSTISILLVSWGGTGHYYINYKSTLSFPVSMNAFLSWADSLANHGGDADDRKNWDNNESIRHYIDIDNYAEFNSTGHIASTFDSVVNLHGLTFVENQGTIPWATVIMYDSLKMSFQQHDWHSAMLHAADLGHYVGDAHQPLHLTRNYDGQYTSQDGVHSRYESNLVYNFLSQLTNYSGDTVHFVTDVNHYVFNYIYNNYQYKDSVLAADTYAKNLVGNTNTYAYYQAFWSHARHFSVLLFHNASHALAELIYTAWVEAGSPPMVSGIYDPNIAYKNNIRLTVYPNPVSSNAHCSFILNSAAKVKFSITDSSGKVFKSFNKSCQSGQNQIEIDVSGLQKGLYYLNLQTKKTFESSRILVIN